MGHAVSALHHGLCRHNVKSVCLVAHRIRRFGRLSVLDRERDCGHNLPSETYLVR